MSLERFRLRVSIRLKILVLIVTVTAASLASYLLVGMSLIIEDKASYIYDYNFGQVKASSEQIASQIQQVRSTLLVLGTLIQSPLKPTPLAESFYQRHRKMLSIGDLLVLRPIDPTHFQTISDFAENSAAMESVLNALDWVPKDFDKRELLVGAAGPGGLPIGIRAQDADGKPIVLLTQLQFNSEIFQERSSKLRLHLIDSSARPLLGTADFFSGLNPRLTQEFEKTLLGSEFQSGAKDWQDGDNDFIVAYQRIPSVDLMVVGLISKQESFRAAEALAERSTILGVSILLIAIAITFVFARGLTRRISEMWHATRRVGQGDFSARVEEGQARDEISDLASSFNIMADRIDELMVATAEKARMEKELETAQAVQNRFFPSSGLMHPKIQVAGKAIAATECAGDWWHYSQIGKHLIVVLGDVTGHGVSSALVTAAAYGAFAISISELRVEKCEDVRSIIGKLVRRMNAAIQAAGAGQTSMTAVISVIDLETGIMKTFSAAHRPVYVYRARSGSVQTGSPFHVLMDGRMPALGEKDVDIPEPETFQLRAGDVIFWYTDGLVECMNTRGVRMRKQTLFKTMARISDEAGSHADMICEKLLQEFSAFLGERAKNPEDDTTLAVGAIPRDAMFLQGKIQEAGCS